MHVPPASTDPDPTTQIAWPTRSRQNLRVPDPMSGPEPVISVENVDGPQNEESEDAKALAIEPGKRRLTHWDLFTLSVSMGGTQICWSTFPGACVTRRVKLTIFLLNSTRTWWEC